MDFSLTAVGRVTSLVLIDHLAHGAERGAAIRGECGEVLGHGGSCHVGDDTRCGPRVRTLRREAEIRAGVRSKHVAG